jgi:hypothetical protein
MIFIVMVFYDLYKEASKIAKCRSVLEITRKNASLSMNELSLAQPNAIAIMMNPGKSYPENSQPERINFEEFNIVQLPKCMFKNIHSQHLTSFY